MGETSNEGQHLGDQIDLSQFYQIFFEEAGDNLHQLEQRLLAIDLEQADDETLNAIFRCAHSIKGGSATFGFTDVAELTHQMESLLDRLRRHEIAPTTAMVDVLLESSDALHLLLARHQGKDTPAPDGSSLQTRLRALAQSERAPTLHAARSSSLDAPAAARAGQRVLDIQIGPLQHPTQADGIAELFRDIPGLGELQSLSSESPEQRTLRVLTSTSDADLLDLFTFHVGREQVCISESGAPSEGERGTELAPWDSPAPLPSARSVVRASQATLTEASTLRVSVSKVDQLINLVGELVITQSMLAQKSRQLDAGSNQPLLAGLAELDRNTRDLQEAVLSIRMIPMSAVFNRFPRLLRDLAAQLGKKVELVTHGEATELDKGLIEKITDPLTHLIRNACDHGIETPDERRLQGKPEQGTLTLAASHCGGSILIEVRDDGRGLSRQKLLAKARQRGLQVSDSMSDAEVWNLIFAPGFSTVEEVSDVSGRGVGMDVVMKNISSLDGTVEIESTPGSGMSVKVRLPLTLAIMDGMLLRVGAEVYILPLSNVIESFQASASSISSVAHSAQLVKVRDEFLPVVELERVLQVPHLCPSSGRSILVVVQADGLRVALLVDDLLGQQQVVVKNLETNYRKVAHISAATILGDGKVALILDPSSLVRSLQR
ncbi:chemotaxis protein CheW [Hydrogenophaga sp.]|uniref:chemotaxis protein CheA n=1 Tax=Hydrogenophaga sp. TaxID=1904254 RepID=UPI00199EF158|nr:chemotaxis protein CheW [Hydrogenophaga sp.]MBD3894195.1 chemotaxis protein CheA [Hydrogenophaga sp.]